MAKIQKLEESLLATENVISSLEKSRESDKVGRVFSVILLYFVSLFLLWYLFIRSMISLYSLSWL